MDQNLKDSAITSLLGLAEVYDQLEEDGFSSRPTRQNRTETGSNTT